MFKKPILLLTAIIATACAATAQTVGQWTVYPLFDGAASTLAEGKTKVFYVSSGRLYSFDKESNETYSYTSQNKLADTNITLSSYNYDGEYLFVAYDTGNIDIIFDNGRVVNLPDIKDASLTSSRAINDVAFADGKIYVATDFGIVVYNESSMQVLESGIYNRAIDFISVQNGYILIYPRDSYGLYYSDVNSRHNTFDKFSHWFGIYPLEIFSVGDNIFYKAGSDNKIYFQDVNWETLSRSTVATDFIPVTTPQVVNGLLRFCTATEIVELDADGNAVSRTAIPDELKGQTLTYRDNLSSVWAIDADGVANYNITTTPVTVLSDKFKPDAANVPQVAYFRLSADGNRIFFSNIGGTQYKTIGAISYDGYWIAQRTNYIENGKFTDVSLYDATLFNSTDIPLQAQNNNKDMYGGPERFAVDPLNADRYFMANALEGLYVINNGTEEAVFNHLNAPMDKTWGGRNPRTYDVNFDPEGNLWVGSWSNIQKGKISPYIILPKDKLYGDLSAVTAADWVESIHKTLDIDNCAGTGFKDMGSLFVKKAPGIMLTWNGKYGAVLVGYDTKGTYTNTADDVACAHSEYIDQDGMTFAPTTLICAVEDLDGRVWVGTDAGPFVITDPKKVTDPTMRITRIKVPRNDGTDYADYLLATDRINDIAVDGINRKWIATESSGVYLVSENGDKILEHYTTDNSDLPSNSVYSVICDPHSNMVYFGLATGLCSYSSTAAPAAEDYSEIYAYPNPVRPGYNGPVTVTGLMDDSLVKIADAAGNVFFQGRSTGGMIVWDGCDATGARVHSGVYYVLVSQNASGSASGAVTKIVVIN